MIDRAYFQVKPAIYFRDLLIPMGTFAAGFAGCLYFSGLLFAACFAVAAVSLHRAGFFIHEVTHQNTNRRLRAFSLFWDMTVGAAALAPSARFIRPHLTHHSLGVFRTKDDPQYFVMRKDWKLAVAILVFIPPIMPIFNLVMTAASAIGGIAAEEAVENYLLRRGMPTGATLRPEHKRRVTWLSRYYLALWVPYAVLATATLPLMYAIHVAAWYLATWRIPLEHRMETRLDASDRADQFADSFTVESPMAYLLQPIGLRYHTAHHMYPGVPYHNLPALHAELKAADPAYRRNVISFRQAVMGGPKPAPEAVD